MIEATAKKAQFLSELCQELGIEAAVVNDRAETAAHDPALRERFASATARAVGSAATVAELVLPFLEPGGLAVLQRGDISQAERAALEDAVLMLGGRTEAEHAIHGRRRLILVRKLAPTPLRFPRRAGIPAKRPLCS